MARSNQLASLAVDIVINARRFRSTTRMMRGDLKRTQTAAHGLATSITRVGLAASAFLIVQRAARLVIDVIKETTLAFAKLEKQIIDVEKIAKIDVSKQFFGLAIELPSATFENISQVMAGAARTGIQGAEGLKEFSKAVIILSEVSGDIVPAEATIGVAQLLKNFDLGTDKALNLVNNIDTLSDGFVTTSGQILTTSKRLAGMAEAAGLTVHELNAVVTALLQTGATATTIRTTLSQFFTKVVPKPLEAGRALGLFGDELINFASLADIDIIAFLKAFINTLKELPEAKAQVALKELQIAGNRTQQVIKLLAKTTEGELDRALKTSADSIDKTSGVLLKYERVAKSTDAGIKDLSKQYTLLKVNFATTKPLTDLRLLLRGLNSDFDNLISPKALQNLDDVNKRLDTLVKKRTKLLRGDTGASTGEKAGGLTGNLPAILISKFIREQQEKGGIAEFGSESERLNKIKEALKREKELEKEKDPIRKRALRASFDAEDKARITGDVVSTAVMEAWSKAILEGKKEVVDLERTHVDQQKKFVNDLIANLPTLKTGFHAKLESQEKRREKALRKTVDPVIIDKIHERFNLLNQDLFQSHREHIKEQVARRKTTELLEREKRLRLQRGAIGGAFGLVGKIGEAFEMIQRVERAGQAFRAAGLDPNAGGLGKAVDNVLKFQLAELFAPAKAKAPQFKGLTQAWKDAVVDVGKKDKEAELRKLNIKAGRALIKALGDAENLPENIQFIVDFLKDVPGLNIK